MCYVPIKEIIELFSSKEKSMLINSCKGKTTETALL